MGLGNLGFAGTSNGDTAGKRVWYTCSKISARQDTWRSPMENTGRNVGVTSWVVPSFNWYAG